MERIEEVSLSTEITEKGEKKERERNSVSKLSCQVVLFCHPFVMYIFSFTVLWVMRSMNR